MEAKKMFLMKTTKTFFLLVADRNTITDKLLRNSLPVHLELAFKVEEGMLQY